MKLFQCIIWDSSGFLYLREESVYVKVWSQAGYQLNREKNHSSQLTTPSFQQCLLLAADQKWGKQQLIITRRSSFLKSYGTRFKEESINEVKTTILIFLKKCDDLTYD